MYIDLAPVLLCQISYLNYRLAAWLVLWFVNWKDDHIHCPITTLPLREGIMTPGCTREIVPVINVLKITMDEKHMLIVKAKDWNVSEMPFSNLAVLRKNLVAAWFYLHSCSVRFQILPMFIFFSSVLSRYNPMHITSQPLCWSPTIVFGLVFDLRCFCRFFFLSHTSLFMFAHRITGYGLAQYVVTWK